MGKLHIVRRATPAPEGVPMAVLDTRETSKIDGRALTSLVEGSGARPPITERQAAVPDDEPQIEIASAPHTTPAPVAQPKRVAHTVRRTPLPPLRADDFADLEQPTAAVVNLDDLDDLLATPLAPPIVEPPTRPSADSFDAPIHTFSITQGVPVQIEADVEIPQPASRELASPPPVQLEIEAAVPAPRRASNLGMWVVCLILIAGSAVALYLQLARL